MKQSFFDIRNGLILKKDDLFNKIKNSKFGVVFKKYLRLGKNKKNQKIFFISILLLLSYFFSTIFVSEYREYRFEKLNNTLLSQKVETIKIPLISEHDIKELYPSDDISSVYENKNFYMFQLYNGQDTSDYDISVYIQKPNNVINFVHNGNYCNINTDIFSINLSVQPFSKDIITLLRIEDINSITRKEDYVINDIRFQSYMITKDSNIDFFLISEQINGYCLVYNLYSTHKDIPVLNYLSYIYIA